MEARRDADIIVVDGDAVHRFHEPSGIGQVRSDGSLALRWIEACHLLARGDLTAVAGADFETVLADPPDDRALSRLVVYRDLRARGYYVSPTYDAGRTPPVDEVHLHVRPRGAAPTADTVAHHVRVAREADALSIASLTDRTVSVVDEELEVTYFGIESFTPDGSIPTPPTARPDAMRVGDVAVLADPPDAFHDSALFGQPAPALEGWLVLNPLEVRYLAQLDRLAMEEPPTEAIDERRYRVYERLREAGTAPRPGLKFGTDFRVYRDLDEPGDPGHSDWLVTVRAPETTLSPRTVSRAVRVATGVRKTLLVALTDGTDVTFRAIRRLTP